MARVFLADCQPLFNEALEALITRDGTNEVVGQASAVPQIVASVPQLKPDLYVIDAGLALSSRPTLVETILAELPDTKVILLAQDTDIDLLLHAIRAGAVGVVGKKSGTQTVLRAVQAVLDGEGVVPRAMLPQLFRRLLDMGDRATDAPLNRLSPREREVLALLGRRLEQRPDRPRALHQPAHGPHPRAEHPPEAGDALQAGGGHLRDAARAGHPPPVGDRGRPPARLADRRSAGRSECRRRRRLLALAPGSRATPARASVACRCGSRPGGPGRRPPRSAPPGWPRPSPTRRSPWPPTGSAGSGSGCGWSRRPAGRPRSAWRSWPGCR